MQLLKTNADGSNPEVTEVPTQNSVEAQIEYGRAASEGGYITLLGNDLSEPVPERPATPLIQAVFANGNVVRQSLIPPPE